MKQPKFEPNSQQIAKATGPQRKKHPNTMVQDPRNDSGYSTWLSSSIFAAIIWTPNSSFSCSVLTGESTAGKTTIALSCFFDLAAVTFSTSA